MLGPGMSSVTSNVGGYSNTSSLSYCYLECKRSCWV